MLANNQLDNIPLNKVLPWIVIVNSKYVFPKLKYYQTFTLHFLDSSLKSMQKRGRSQSGPCNKIFY